MTRRLVISWIAALLAVVALAQVRPAGADAVPVDQSFEAGSSPNMPINLGVAQSFTASVTGRLDAVDLKVAQSFAVGPPLIVDILSMPSPTILGPVVSSTAVPSGTFPGTCYVWRTPFFSTPYWEFTGCTPAWRTIALATPVTSVAGQRYAVRVSAMTNNGMSSYHTTVAPDGYAGGQFWQGFWDGQDMAFRTRVTPATTYYRDADGDGYGDPSSTPVDSVTPVNGAVPNDDDCDDGDAGVHPGAPEVGNTIDDDCDGEVDEGFALAQLDGDGDGYGTGLPVFQPDPPPTGWAAAGGDCDDGDATVAPGAPELANGIDDDCDGEVDEGWVLAYLDEDGDGVGGSTSEVKALPLPAGWVTSTGDCADADAATVACPPVAYYVDDDGDGYGSSWYPPIHATEPVPGRVPNADDCDDKSSSVHPGAAEVRNAVDDDCDGSVDEGFVLAYHDGDGDGYGGGWAEWMTEPLAPGWTTTGGDCDDADASIHEGCPEPADDDGDGYEVPRDCDDADAATYPGAPEVQDGKDNNCDGTVDELVKYADYDLDGYGAGQAIPAEKWWSYEPYLSFDGTDCDDSDPTVHVGCGSGGGPIDGDGDGVTIDRDCDDGDATVHPGAIEYPDGLDNDCDGAIDDIEPLYLDMDGDGYGAGEPVPPELWPFVPKLSPNDEDCDDFDRSIHEGCVVAPPDSAPIATTADPLPFDEDTPIVLTLTGDDADGDSLTFEITELPAHGVLDVAPDGVTVTYTPTPNWHGTDGFTYIVAANGATSEPDAVVLTVLPVTDATTVEYTGPAQRVLSGKDPKLNLSALLTSDDPACVDGRIVTFTLAGAQVHGPYPGLSATDGAVELATSMKDWATGTYTITIGVAADDGCASTTTVSTMTILATRVRGGKA